MATILLASSVRAQTPAPDQALAQWLAYVERIAPKSPEQCTPQLAADLAKAKLAIEQWAVQMTDLRSVNGLDQALRIARRLLDAKRRIDALIDATFELRSQFADNSSDEDSLIRIRSFLRSTTQLIDLSGRLRYMQHDSLEAVATYLCPTAVERAQLVDVLTEYRSSIGAVVAARYLAPLPTQPGAAVRGNTPPSAGHDAVRSRVLRLIAASGELSVLPQVAAMLLDSNTPPNLVLGAVETFRAIGLPQTPRPGASVDPAATELPKPAITAQALAERLARLSQQPLSAEQRTHCDELLAWSSRIAKQGLVEPSYRLGRFEVQPGDWLLMRNPSPYNLFTDLSPGLFTHVGVVTTERGDDGIERMVIVDLPERGAKMPATNVDAFLERTLHYVFLRHPDPAIAATMADAARQMIGNDTEFDLNFRTDRVQELKGQPLKGKKIQTYCAGLLLVCAQQTSADRREFFPLDEYPAPGRTVENLAKLGMSFGDEFISPTGALFSPRLELIGRREPMYDPAREIEEAVFDRFASQLITAELVPTPDLFDSLRLKVAEAARHNALLAQALAAAAGVSKEMDLVAAAKAAAVVETLDEIAFGASAEFFAAREAVRAGSEDALRRAGRSEADLNRVRMYRQRHADLVQQFQAGALTPRRLRTSLVVYYSQSGQREIDRRFFSGK